MQWHENKNGAQTTLGKALLLGVQSLSFRKAKQGYFCKYTKFLRMLFLAVLCASVPACFPGGLNDKGGYTHQLSYAEAATPVGSEPFDVLCIDPQEIERRKKLSEEKRQNLGPPVKKVPASKYKGGCERTGQSSVFVLFHLWPVTRPLDPDYAMGLVVQELEGDTMIHLRLWHETHYYSILGHAAVLKIKGDVIRYRTGVPPTTEKSKPRKKRRDRPRQEKTNANKGNIKK